MLKVMLLFTGLAAFSTDCQMPNYRDCTGHKIYVGLVNTQNEQHLHLPTIIIEEHYFDPTMTDRPRTIALSNGDGTFWRFDIAQGERVTLEPISDMCAERGCVTLVKKLKEGANPECPTLENYQDVYWLSQMSDMTTDRGEIRRESLWSPHEPNSRLAAQFLLRAGELSSFDFTRKYKAQDEIIKWELKGNDPRFARAMADLALLERQFSSDSPPPHLQFWTRRGPDWVKTQKIVLSPFQEGYAIVEVKNVPPGQLCKEVSAEKDGPKDNPHFGYFYKLLYGDKPDSLPTAASATCSETRIPVSTSELSLCGQPGSRLNDPQCPVSMFNTPATLR